MNENETNALKQKPQHDDNGKGKDIVSIIINDSTYKVHQGRLNVSEIRILDDIPITDVIYLLPEYLLLDNEGFVIVHGGEQFKSGGSSGHSS
jgi:hypothetical protein